MFATVWAYRINPGSRDAFIEIYGPDGEWVKLFRQHPGFIRTDLYEDVASPGQFMSADLWRDKADYEAFQKRNGDNYRDLDRKCAYLSEQSHYGFFEGVKAYAPIVFSDIE